MGQALYHDLAPFYRLVDPPEDHAGECAAYRDALERTAAPRPETLLELGAGAGHNALHLKRRFRCTLTEPSPAMQALSRALNPECEHLPGDMRTMRLGRTFDAVLVHDAVAYMTSEADLRAAVTTAFVHLRPGGAAVFAPDDLRDQFDEATVPLAGDDGIRAVRGLEWTWDPDPTDDTCVAEYVLLLREGGQVRAVHERHVVGLFSAATWRHILEEVGFEVATFDRPIEVDGELGHVFVGRRPPG
jgi:hypothetical protein